MRKSDKHKAIRARAESALEDLYHNATVNYPRDFYGRGDDYFQSWFGGAAQFEVEYLADGGAYGSNYRATLAAPCNAGKYQSEAARRYYVSHGMRKMQEKRNDCGALTGWRVMELAVRKAQEKSQSALWHKWFKSYGTIPRRADTTRNNSQWERITEYGKLYQWGRGGRTLAPVDLVRQGGGSSFSIATDVSEKSISDCIELIRIVESFNRCVESWCKSVPELWREHCEAEDAEKLAAKRRQAARKAKETRERNYWACRGVMTA